jgi:energy-coupling factor transport system ATP-binding protein
MVLDEPTFGQDRRTWLSLVRLLQRELERGGTIVSVTHDAGVVEHLGDHRILLEPAKLGRHAA